MLTNHRYNFHTLAPGVLGVGYKNVKLTAILTYEVASTLTPVLTKHRAVYPSLPAGTIDDPMAYQYYMFKTESGDTLFIADAWIDTNSVEEVSGISFDVKFRGVTSDQYETVRLALVAAGLTGFEMVRV